MFYMKEMDELYDEMAKKGYDYLEGDTPIKLSAQPNEALLNIVNKYRGTNSVCEKTLKIFKERGVIQPVGQTSVYRPILVD